MARQSVLWTCYNEPRSNVLREAKIQQSPTSLKTDSASVPENPPNTATVTYADAGVDIDRANRTKKRIKYLAHKTFNRGVLSEIGGFGALFAIDKKYVSPVLVSSV